jgi:ABC-type amino acid transport substrate-binding protein
MMTIIKLSYATTYIFLKVKATMKKIMLTIFSMILCFNITHNAYGFVRYEEKHPSRTIELTMLGHMDYAPFGWHEENSQFSLGGYYTIFQPILDLLKKEINAKIKVKYGVKNLDDMAQKVREGSVDFFVGAYSKTEVYRGLHLLYPAVIYNPITVFMMPNRISEVKTTEDLKKLKGVRNTKEVFSDFIEKKASEYNITEVDNMYQAFEKLYNREVDYVLSSYYYGMIEAIKLGIETQIAASKQPLWRIPLFIGVAKNSPRRDIISKRITKHLSNENNLKAFEEKLQEIIVEFQKRYKGVAAPSFVKDNIKNEEEPQNNTNMAE